ncbi:MAG: hypothetical protein Q9178_007957 [Gyalolechia marmorata]
MSLMEEQFKSLRASTLRRPDLKEQIGLRKQAKDNAAEWYQKVDKEYPPMAFYMKECVYIQKWFHQKAAIRSCDHETVIQGEAIKLYANAVLEWENPGDLVGEGKLQGMAKELRRKVISG